jgi:hypothetical protein
MHWHYKRGRQRGTLEITLWPLGRRAWFAVHANRGAAWIDDAITAIGAALCVSPQTNRRRCCPSTTFDLH